MERFRELCELSALALSDDAKSERAEGPVERLLAWLGYRPRPDEPSFDRANAVALLRAAAGFTRLFQLLAAEAPGLVCFGAEVDPFAGAPAPEGWQQHWSVSGTGLTLRAAFESCVGEGIELLSQFARETDLFESAPLAAGLAALSPESGEAFADLLAAVPPGASVEWCGAFRLADRRPVRLPADLCFRRPLRQRAIAPPHPVGIGCGAGPSFEAAALHALLELVERDAACLWWQGGRRGRMIGVDTEAGRAVADLLPALRRGQRTRRSWLLDITSDLGIPAVASISSTADGFGFACGVAARPSLAEAATSALREMCQIELAHQVVEIKRSESGDARLNAIDLAHLRRRREIDTGSCTLLHPLPPAPTHRDLAPAPPGQMLQHLVEHLAAQGIETFALDLTRPDLAISAARVVCPLLAKETAANAMPGSYGSRLRRAIEETGGGNICTGGLPLM